MMVSAKEIAYCMLEYAEFSSVIIQRPDSEPDFIKKHLTITSLVRSNNLKKLCNSKSKGQLILNYPEFFIVQRKSLREKMCTEKEKKII